MGASKLARAARLRPLLAILVFLFILLVIHTSLIELASSHGEAAETEDDRAGHTNAEELRQGRLLETRKRLQEWATRWKPTQQQQSGIIPPPPPLRNPPPTYLSSTVRPSTSSVPTPAPTTTPHPSEEAKHTRMADSASLTRMSTPPGASGSMLSFSSALATFERNLMMEHVGGNPEQPSKEFVTIEEEAGRGVPLPYDTNFTELPERWEACDARDADFTVERDKLCQEYLQNKNNMRFIKAMPSRLLQGRTIKMKIYYAHNNIRTIVKLSQRKFYFEAASEFLAYSVDRALKFNRVPPTVFVPIPLDYLRAATAHSPLLSQWFHRYVVLYNYTSRNFVPCHYPSEQPNAAGQSATCAMAAVQLWMKDVHPALDTFLALPYEYDESFARKYFIPGHELWSVIKSARLRSIGELLDRFIFDFLIGNSDRGMNDHNNFVYGGCSAKTSCEVEAPQNRIKGLARYAYLDHGSSFYSHKESPDSPFFGDISRIHICRHRRSTYDRLKQHRSRGENYFPLITYMEPSIPPAIYNVSYDSVIRKVQTRLDKVVRVVEQCLTKYPEDEVFSIPDYDKIRITEEDATLDEE